MSSKTGYNSLGRASQVSANTIRNPALLHHHPQPKQFHGNEIVELNVGGALFATRFQTLATSSSPYFEAMFRIGENGRIVEMPGAVLKDKAGRVFIDRDGELFRFVLQYFRDGKHSVLPNDIQHLKMVRREAEFFGLQGLKNMIDRILADPERNTTAFHLQQRQQQGATEEMIHLLQKLSHQLSINTYTQLNGVRR